MRVKEEKRVKETIADIGRLLRDGTAVKWMSE